MKASYELWEHTYFNILVGLYSIYLKDMSGGEVTFKLDNNFEDFAKYIYSASSGEIDPFANSLNSKNENMYFEYCLQKNGEKNTKT